MIGQRFLTHSFELAAMAALLLAGVVGLIHPQWAADLSGWGYAWYAVLAAGAVVVLVAFFWPSAITALYVERAGLVVVTWQLISVGVVVQLYDDGLELRIAGLTCLLISAGCIGRLVRITADLRELRYADRA